MPCVKLFCISAGHSTIPPRDPGAVANGYVEAQEAAKVRDEVVKLLRLKNISVVTDGSDGINEPLRKALLLAKKADVAIEFHFNASANPAATGIEVLCKPKHKALAQTIAGAIASATKISLRGDRGYKADNSGQHHRLAFCEAGGLIVEICFISNRSDMAAYARNFSQICKNLAEVLEKL